MVRCTEGPGPQQGLLPVQQPRNRKDLRCFNRFRKREVWDDRYEPLGEHGFPGSRGTDHDQVVPTRGGNLERAFYLLLSADITEIG